MANWYGTLMEGGRKYGRCTIMRAVVRCPMQGVINALEKDNKKDQ